MRVEIPPPEQTIKKRQTMYNLYQQMDAIFNPANAKAVIRKAEQRQVIDLKPEDVEDVTENDEEEIQMAHITDEDYSAIEKRIKRDYSGEGYMDFEDIHRGKGFNVRTTGTMYREISHLGDGHTTPFETEEKLEINIESVACYNAAGDEILSDFDNTKIS